MNVGIIGTGKLGICLALLLEDAGFDVYASDKNKSLVQSLASKNFESDEPQVTFYLQKSKNLYVSQQNQDVINACDIIFCVTATPSLQNNSYDVSSIAEIIQEINETNIKNKKTLVIVSTTNPGDCDVFQSNSSFCDVIYSPEFIAQGSIISDIINSENLIIGGENLEVMEQIKEIYHKISLKKPKPNYMTCKAAEISKIAINCFLTTKISFANMIGQILFTSGLESEIENVLSTIGQDSRIGNKYLKFGFGFGGPCFPRDNKAFSYYTKTLNIDNLLGEVTDKLNLNHTEFLYNYFEQQNASNLPYYFESLSYKKNINIFTESQYLQLANTFASKRKKLYCKKNTELTNFLTKNCYPKLLEQTTFVETIKDIQEKVFNIQL